MFVAAHKANIRLQPSIEAKVIAQLPIGAKVKLFNKTVSGFM